MRWFTPPVVRSRPAYAVSRALARARTVAPATLVLFAADACDNRVADAPGVGGVIDRPVAVLAASSTDVTTTELYLVSENGGTSIRVPTFTGAKWQVRWSGDGRRLALTGNTLDSRSDRVAFTSDVWVMNADGSGLRQITRDGVSGSATWLADGRLVYVYAAPNQGLQWFAVPATGGPALPLTLRQGAPVYTPDWSRTAPQMSFNDDTTIFTAAVDGSAERAIAGGTLPRWSPSGDRIAYLGRQDGGPKLFVISPVARARPVVVVPDLTAFAGGFTWSPDGTRILWIRNTAAGTEAVVSQANGSGAPTTFVQRGPNVTAYDVDVDWRPTPLPVP